MTTVSWVILTHNRSEVVQASFFHNLRVAGAKHDELIWCDNGSQDFPAFLYDHADVTIINKKNLGVAKGYNRALGLATMDYIVITGCDMLMPDNWLITFKDYVEKVPETGVACMYSHPIDRVKERLRLPGRQMINGLPIIHAMPVERRIFKRELLAEFGYFPETFGMYGYDDMAWAYRAEKVCKDLDLIHYIIPDMVAEHLGTEGIQRPDGREDHDYHMFKKREAENPKKREEFDRRRALGWPRFTPYL